MSLARDAGPSPEAVRLDLWLWAARWYKTRALARQAIEASRVRVAGQPCKPARLLRVGDTLAIARGEEHFQVEVLGLQAQRGPASVAQGLYRETPASMRAREAAAVQRRADRLAAPVPPPVRPGKHDRHRIKAFKQKAGEAE